MVCLLTNRVPIIADQEVKLALYNFLGNQFRSEEEYKQNTTRALQEKGYDEEDIKSI